MALISGESDRIGPLTMTQIHVGGGVFALALTLVHYKQRPVTPRTTDMNRRNAVRSAGLLGASAIAYLIGEWTLEVTGARGADRRFTGSHEIELGRRVPPTQWLNDSVQDLDTRAHLVATPRGPLTAADIDRVGESITATLDCTGGWYANRTWSGVRLDRVLADTRGESVVVRSVTGYWRRFPLTQADRLWLVTRLEGEALRPGNGAPIRLVAPDRRGFWWVKWVDEVEVDDLPNWFQPPLPLA